MRCNRPTIFKPLQVIAEVWVLDSEVDQFLVEFDTADAAPDHNRSAPFDLPDLAVHRYRRDQHTIGTAFGSVPVRVENIDAAVAAQEQISRAVRVVPGVCCQCSGKTFSGVQQLIADLCLFFIEDVVAVHNIDSRASGYEKLLAVRCPEVIIVKVREAVQKADRSLIIHIAEAVAGYDKHSV